MTPDERRRNRPFEEMTSISKAMDRSSKTGLLHLLSNRFRLTRIWRETVGPEVAAKTTILSFSMGVMTVSVAGPAYLERYRYELEGWRRRLNIELGEEVVTRIALRVEGY